MMSSLYIGATGLKSHGEGMAVITHNLANVNTIAYKQQSMQYTELASQYLTADSNLVTNMSQKGAGAVPGAIRTLFEQGGLERGSEATDLSVNGIGFFGVSANGQIHYTRAGDFRFSSDGRLLDPSGWNVLGRAIKGGVVDAAVSPVILDPSASILSAKATGSLSVSSQLGGLASRGDNPANPFFSMTADWNGTRTPPLNAGSYSYSDTVSFYDANGELRTGTIYYALAGKDGGNTAVEYLVAYAPDMDASSRAETDCAGLLMAGVITFDSAGQMSNLLAFTPPSSGSPAALNAWVPAPLSAEGYPMFTAHAAGATAQSISLNMGLALSGSAGTGLVSAADAALAPSSVYKRNSAAKLNPAASTYYGGTCANIMTKRDGYAEGLLRGLSVTADGIVRGSYSNGETQDLYRISLYRFASQDGLHNEGGNHFSATPEAGVIEEGIPGTENFGTLSQYSLEGSNVDYAREFSLMIVTQRGFQMNSKVVTTSDEMLKKALELKR
ncbi:MAG: flagellar hook-basal body complex protein [Desulfovibrio sp.]|jgi:flagellar hook protein FlgE|nr:flagellar hook-basal body complex protein [Desulfovibrio sp.]